MTLRIGHNLSKNSLLSDAILHLRRTSTRPRLLDPFSSPVNLRQVKTSDGDTINVPINRLEKYLPPMSVFAYFDCYSHFFDASGFRQGMRLSGHLTKIYIGGEMRLSYTGGSLRYRLHWGGRVAAVYLSSLDCTDSPFV